MTSTIPWLTLQQKLAELFNLYPSSLHAQYRFSTDAKGSLPLDLTTRLHFDMMITLLQPLIIPPHLQSGKCSTWKMKPVMVQVFNKDDEPLSTESRGGSKVQAAVSTRCKHMLTNTQKTSKFSSVLSDSNTDHQKSEGKQFHEKRIAAWKAITNKFSCDIHSLPDKPILCWKDPVQHLCYPITESNLNLWVTLHASTYITFCFEAR